MSDHTHVAHDLGNIGFEGTHDDDDGGDDDDSPGLISDAHIAQAGPTHTKKKKKKKKIEKHGAEGGGEGDFIGNKGVLVFNFGTKDTTLDENQKRVLQSQKTKFKTQGVQLLITGHSASDEDASVSSKRAEAVSTFLRTDDSMKIPDANIIDVVGVGSSHPVADEKKGGKDAKKRNRSVEVKMVTAAEYLHEDISAGDGKGVGKNAPESDESHWASYADIAAHVIAAVFEETALALGAELLGPFLMMLDVAMAWEEAKQSQMRFAFFDGVSRGSTSAANYLAAKHARVSYDNIEKQSMADINDMTYFPAETWEAQWSMSKGIKAAVDVYDPAMKKTEELVRARLEAMGKKGTELKTVYDKLIPQVRAQVAYQLNDKVRAEARSLRTK